MITLGALLSAEKFTRSTPSSVRRMEQILRVKQKVTSGKMSLDWMLADDFMDNYEPRGRESEQFMMLCFGAATSLLHRTPRVRIPGYVEEVVPLYQLDDFRRFFRMSRATFEAMCRIVANSPHLTTTSGGRRPIPLDKQLLSVLWYLGSQDTFHKVADRFDITESSFARVRRRVFKAFLDDMHKYISWPSPQERQNIAFQFERRKGFPNIVGAIDGSHIEITAPRNNPQCYVNRKQFHSLVLQGICGQDLRFIHCTTGYPGSVHDARVLRRSDIWDRGLAMCGRGHLIGDGAYPCKRWLMTPYRNNGHMTPQHTHYNYCLSNSRVCIERAFGLLKGRFRRLKLISTTEVSTACDIIMVSCILHNAILIAGDEIEDFLQDYDHNMPPPPINIAENDAEGFLKRDIIARNLP